MSPSPIARCRYSKGGFEGWFELSTAAWICSTDEQCQKQSHPRLVPEMASKRTQTARHMIYHGNPNRALPPPLHALTPKTRVEKYRPVYLDDIVGNTETIERLKIIAKDGNMPHVIISGMPGIGKTTSILCLARQLLGDAYKEAVLELNASDERGTSSSRSPQSRPHH